MVVPRFPVKKGADDIQVVWDLKKNSLNACMYTPSFFLYTPSSSYARRVEARMYGSDADVEEQFHNFLLHESEQAYCGVELPKDLLEESKLERTLEGSPLKAQWFMQFGRLVFGWQSSPYFALCMHVRCIELVKRDPKDPTSAFCYEQVELNLPGVESYDPALPRVCQIRHNGHTAAVILNYFDDIRPYGLYSEIAAEVARQVSSGIQYLSEQDSLQKHCPVSQRPGAWAGVIVYSYGPRPRPEVHLSEEVG